MKDLKVGTIVTITKGTHSGTLARVAGRSFCDGYTLANASTGKKLWNDSFGSFDNSWLTPVL